MITAIEALERLQTGNQRFVDNLTAQSPTTQAQLSDLSAAQAPFAIILGCSDSRVPAEIVFDQGLGDLFVIRVASNIVAPSQVGSVEFAAAQFGTPLVVVLGHTNCGAIDATLHHMQNPGDHATDNLKSIVDRIAPSMTSLVEANAVTDQKALAYHCMRANVRASVNQLKHGSSALEGLVAASQLQICGAYYDLDSGSVHFFE